MLWARTLLFTILVPGSVMGLVPFLLVKSDIGPHVPLGAAKYFGLAPLLAGLTTILWCFNDFVVRGKGTPGPIRPAVESGACRPLSLCAEPPVSRSGHDRRWRSRPRREGFSLRLRRSPGRLVPRLRDPSRGADVAKIVRRILSPLLRGSSPMVAPLARGRLNERDDGSRLRVFRPLPYQSVRVRTA